MGKHLKPLGLCLFLFPILLFAGCKHFETRRVVKDVKISIYSFEELCSIGSPSVRMFFQSPPHKMVNLDCPVILFYEFSMKDTLMEDTGGHSRYYSNSVMVEDSLYDIRIRMCGDEIIPDEWMYTKTRESIQLNEYYYGGIPHSEREFLNRINDYISGRDEHARSVTALLGGIFLLQKPAEVHAESGSACKIQAIFSFQSGKEYADSASVVIW